MIIWRDKYSVNIESIDNEHKKLVEILNRLLNGMKSKIHSDEIKAVLKELITYTKTHFINEETLMQQAGYQDLAEHREKHQNFIEELRGHVDSFRQGKTLSLPIELNSFLQEWILNHIMKADKDYSEALISAGVK